MVASHRWRQVCVIVGMTLLVLILGAIVLPPTGEGAAAPVRSRSRPSTWPAPE